MSCTGNASGSLHSPSGAKLSDAHCHGISERMPSVVRKPTFKLLHEELSACLAEREDNPAKSRANAGSAGNPADQSAVDAVLTSLRDNGDVMRLSPAALLNFGRFCHLDFHRLIALVVKGEWERYVLPRLPVGKTVEDIFTDGLSAIRDLSSGFSMAIDGAGLYRLFEGDARFASSNGYDEKDFRDLVRHMVLAEVHLFAGKSPELVNFIAGEEAQRALLKGVSADAAEEFWKKKRIWIELENEVGGLLLKLEQQTLRNRKLHRKWMSTFGHIYIPLVETEYRYTSLIYRIRCKEEDPDLSLEELEELEEENRQLEEEHLARLKKSALAIRMDLPGPGGMPLDDEDMDEYEKECKKLLRKIWRLTHPDRIEQEKFTPEQKKKLRAYFEEAVPYQDRGTLDDDEVILAMRSLEALQDLLAKVEAVWKSMGIDCNEQSVIQGETLAEQYAWLDARIIALEEESGQVRAELMAAVNDPEYLEMVACMASSEQMDRITEEMSTKLAWYDEQVKCLEQRLGELFGN